MGTGYQAYLDAIKNIESVNITIEDKSNKTERALKATEEEKIVKQEKTLESIHTRWLPWS